jgi:hypothetical protein
VAEHLKRVLTVVLPEPHATERDAVQAILQAKRLQEKVQRRCAFTPVVEEEEGAGAGQCQSRQE